MHFVGVYSELFVPPVEMTDDQVKALILNFLLRRKCWGGKYFNKQKLIRYIGQDVLNDGKEVTRRLDKLIKDRWVFQGKKRKTVSLNPSLTREIPDFIDQHIID